MSSSKPKTKSAKVISLLCRNKGASIAEISKVTGWKAHSIKAFVTGIRKKGYAIALEQHEGKGKCYRITPKPKPTKAGQS